MHRKTIEFAIQAKHNGKFDDVSVYNKWTCRWPEPKIKWPEMIRQSYDWDYQSRKHRHIRLMKRETVESIIHFDKE